MQARVAALEAQVAQLTRPPKTPDTSSKLPSQGHKQERSKPAVDRAPRKGRPDVSRALHPEPGRVVEAALQHCPKCHAVFPQEQQTP